MAPSEAAGGFDMASIPPRYADVVSIEVQGLQGEDAQRCAQMFKRAAQAHGLPLLAVAVWPRRRENIKTGEVTPAVVAHFEPFTNEAAVSMISHDAKASFPGRQVWISCSA